MSKVFEIAADQGAVLKSSQLRKLKMIFEELCDEYHLNHDQQERRDALAMALLKYARTSYDESKLRIVAQRAIAAK